MPSLSSLNPFNRDKGPEQQVRINVGVSKAEIAWGRARLIDNAESRLDVGLKPIVDSTSPRLFDREIDAPEFGTNIVDLTARQAIEQSGLQPKVAEAREAIDEVFKHGA